MEEADRDPHDQEVEDVENQEFYTSYAEGIDLICEFNNLSKKAVAPAIAIVPTGIETLLGLKKGSKIF